MQAEASCMPIPGDIRKRKPVNDLGVGLLRSGARQDVGDGASQNFAMGGPKRRNGLLGRPGRSAEGVHRRTIQVGLGKGVKRVALGGKLVVGR